VAGLLQARGDDGVRWSRAGVEDSTAADSAAWSPRLVMTLRASLVFASFGQAECERAAGGQEASIDEGLGALHAALDSRRVREMVVFGPMAFDEEAPASRGIYAGLNERLRPIASSAAAWARERSLAHIDLFAITMSVYEKLRAAGEAPTTDGRMPTELASTLIAADVLAALGVTRETLGEIGWRPCGEPGYEAARRIDPTLPALAPGQGAGSFAVAQSLRVYDAHWEILWRDLDQGLHPDHAHRVEILTMQRMEVEANWQSVREVVAEARGAATTP
jgi:hypothetical protein